jgi:uncharacterized membrane protein YidH (DUF202 family)
MPFLRQLLIGCRQGRRGHDHKRRRLARIIILSTVAVLLPGNGAMNRIIYRITRRIGESRLNWQFIDTTCSLVTNGVVANVVVVVVVVAVDSKASCDAVTMTFELLLYTIELPFGIERTSPTCDSVDSAWAAAPKTVFCYVCRLTIDNSVILIIISSSSSNLVALT